VDDELDIDGDEDTILYGETQFFEGDIIARDDDDTEAGAHRGTASPMSEDNEPQTRSLRGLVAARKMVVTLREVDIEGEEEDERVSVGSSAGAGRASPPTYLFAPNGGNNNDTHIASLMAKIEQLVRFLCETTKNFTDDITGVRTSAAC
jgi:hypothetical protein